MTSGNHLLPGMTPIPVDVIALAVAALREPLQGMHGNTSAVQANAHMRNALEAALEALDGRDGWAILRKRA